MLQPTDAAPGTDPARAPAGPYHRSRHPGARWLRRGVGPYLLLGDVLAALVADVLVPPPSAVHLLGLPALVLVFWRAGLYRSRLSLSIVDDLPYVAGATAVTWAFQVALSSVVAGPQDATAHLRQSAVLLAAVCVTRLVGYQVVHRARARGTVGHRTLVVGAGQVGVRLATTLLERRGYGLRPVGFIDADVSESHRDTLPVPVLGDYGSLAAVITDHAIRDVVIAFGRERESGLVDILRTCDRLDVEVFIVPRLFEMRQAHRHTDEIWGVPVTRVRRAVFFSPWWRVKRLVDVLAASTVLVLAAPLLAACALAVRLEGGPGVVFRQSRVGLDGRPFEVLKFRSLRPADESESATNWNIRHDDRLGRVGRLLRATSLDELPQLWNIVRGDMSLVGPRPERPHFVEQFSAHVPRYTARHRVPAGLTGWAQAHGLRGDTSIEDRARFDNYYIENWSPWLDVRIVVKTVGQVLLRRGG